MGKPDFLTSGEESRLFPVLADTSKEGRTLSIFLSCLEKVDEFGAALLGSIGHKVGARSRIETFTEIKFKNNNEKSHRPDGLIQATNGSKIWHAIVEAKVGNSDLTTEQILNYIEIAKSNSIETIVTISNQFSPFPSHHPLHATLGTQKKVSVLHWSWMYILTQAKLLLDNDEIIDRDQKIILHELTRFLSHDSAGVKNFDQMPAIWPDIVSGVRSGQKLSINSDETKEIVGAWHQEFRDLAFKLSQGTKTNVSIQISRAHAADPNARLKSASSEFANSNSLTGTLLIPNAASPVEVSADLVSRTILVSMRLRAPGDKKGTKARVNWLLRQLPKPLNADIYLRMFWPGRTPHTQHRLADLEQNIDLASKDRVDQVVQSFEIILVKDLGARFGQRRNFISDLEDAVPTFYKAIGEHVKAWQAPAPKIQDSFSIDPDSEANSPNEGSTSTP